VAIHALLQDAFARHCGVAPIGLDRLALARQDRPQAPFRINRPRPRGAPAPQPPPERARLRAPDIPRGGGIKRENRAASHAFHPTVTCPW